MSVVKFIKTTAAAYSKYTGEVKPVAGAIYYVLDDSVKDAPVGRIYVDGICYGEANAKGKTVLDAAIETDESSGKKGQIKVTYTDGTFSHIPLPEGKVYTAGKGINISESDEISALDETLNEDLVVTGVTVGNYSNGKTITKGTSIQALLKEMLTKEIDCSIKSTPRVALRGVSASTKIVGESVTGTLDYTYTDGQFTKPDGSVVNAGCAVSNPVYVGSLPLTVALGVNKFKVTVDYAASTADLKTNLGNPSKVSIGAGSVSSSEVVINGTYPVYATTSDANTMTQQPLSTWNASIGSMSSGNMKLVASTKAAPRKFSLPREATSLTQLNPLSGKYESVALSAYNKTTEVKTFGSEEHTYYVYTYSGDAEGSVTVNVKF